MLIVLSILFINMLFINVNLLKVLLDIKKVPLTSVESARLLLYPVDQMK